MKPTHRQTLPKEDALCHRLCTDAIIVKPSSATRGWGAGTRTPIDDTRNHCPAIRRHPTTDADMKQGNACVNQPRSDKSDDLDLEPIAPIQLNLSPLFPPFSEHLLS